MIYYEYKTGAVLRRFVLPRPPYYGAVLSPDHRYLIDQVNLKGDLAVYETATGRPRGIIATGGGWLMEDHRRFSFTLSPDGKTLATGNPDTTILIWDLDRPLGGKSDLPPPKTAAEAEPLWDLLGHPDPKKAEPAVWALRRAPKPALALLQKRLQPAHKQEAQQLQTWIAQLDSDRFKQREIANRNLLIAGEQALPALRAALKKPLSLEQHLRLQALIERITTPGQPGTASPVVLFCLRELRALEVLERIGTDEARRLVERVAGGDEAALLTREARLILERWR